MGSASPKSDHRHQTRPDQRRAALIDGASWIRQGGDVSRIHRAGAMELGSPQVVGEVSNQRNLLQTVWVSEVEGV